jgi:hypothetical protein
MFCADKFCIRQQVLPCPPHRAWRGRKPIRRGRCASSLDKRREAPHLSSVASQKQASISCPPTANFVGGSATPTIALPSWQILHGIQ